MYCGVAHGSASARCRSVSGTMSRKPFRKVFSSVSRRRFGTVVLPCFATLATRFREDRLELVWKRMTPVSGEIPKCCQTVLLRPSRKRLARRCHCDRIFVSLPSPTMPTFLTMKEAATIVGKSPSSIRRVIYPIIEDDKHPDRKHIRPTVDEVAKLRVKGAVPKNPYSSRYSVGRHRRTDAFSP